MPQTTLCILSDGACIGDDGNGDGNSNDGASISDGNNAGDSTDGASDGNDSNYATAARATATAMATATTTGTATTAPATTFHDDGNDSNGASDGAPSATTTATQPDNDRHPTLRPSATMNLAAAESSFAVALDAYERARFTPRFHRSSRDLANAASDLATAFEHATAHTYSPTIHDGEASSRTPTVREPRPKSTVRFDLEAAQERSPPPAAQQWERRHASAHPSAAEVDSRSFSTAPSVWSLPRPPGRQTERTRTTSTETRDHSHDLLKKGKKRRRRRRGRRRERPQNKPLAPPPTPSTTSHKIPPAGIQKMRQHLSSKSVTTQESSQMGSDLTTLLSRQQDWSSNKKKKISKQSLRYFRRKRCGK